MAFFGKHTTRDRFLSRKSFGRAHDVVGAKEVSKMLVLHEFLNLCASRAKIYYKAEAPSQNLTCKHTIYQANTEAEEGKSCLKTID